MVVRPIFTVNIPVDSSKWILVLPGFFRFQWQSSWYGLQSFWYGILNYFYKLRFTCASAAWKKYVQLFYIMPNTFYLIFSLYMNYIKDFLCFDLKEFVPSVISLSGNIFDLIWKLLKLCFFLCLLKSFHQNIIPLVFHQFQHGFVGLDC